MTEKLIFSGFGGQGVLTLGQIVAMLGMNKGKKVTWMPSYGAEMRGGTSNCTVIISDEIIGSPIVNNDFTMLIAMNNPSVDKFLPRVADNGIVIINSSIVTREINSNVRSIPVDATNICSKAGNLKGQNMVMLGAYLGAYTEYSTDDVLEVFKTKFTGKKEVFIDSNMECVKMGLLAAEEILKA